MSGRLATCMDAQMILARQNGRHLLIYLKQRREIGGGSRKIGV